MIRVALFFAVFFTVALAPQRADALLCHPILGCTCSVTASDIDFGDFTPFAGAQDAVGEIEVDCTGVIDVAPTILTQLDDGVWGTFAARKMRSAIGGHDLNYNLYTTNQHTIIAGDGTSGSAAIWISGGLVTLGRWRRTRSVYARATPTTATRPGEYSDTVVVRIVW